MSFYTFQDLIADRSGDVFGVIGDSNADGRGVTIPTVAVQTLFKWNTSTSRFDEITTQSVANDGGGIYGSMYQQFATDYKALTGKAVCLVNGASGGAEFYPNGDNNNWYTSGTLYAAFTAQMTAALAAAGKSVPTAIFLCLGINDFRATHSIANITTGFDSLMSRLEADYPGVDILAIQMGRSESVANNLLMFQIRKLFRDKFDSTSNFHLFASGATGIGITASGGDFDFYLPDNLHFSQTALDYFGHFGSRWFEMSAYSSKKPVRCYLSQLFDQPNSTRRGLIEAAYDSMGNTIWAKQNQLFRFKTSSKLNTFVDWAFMGYAIYIGTVTFVADSYIQTPGALSGGIGQGFNASWAGNYNAMNGVSVTDFAFAVYLITAQTSAGTAAVMAGRADASASFRFAQGSGAANTNVYALSLTQTNGTQPDLASGTVYSAVRSGGNQELWRNNTVDVTAAVANTGFVANSGPVIGFYRASPAADSFPYAGRFGFMVIGPATDHATVVTALKTLTDSW